MSKKSNLESSDVIKTPYGFRHPLARRVQTDVSGESITQQEFAKDLEINKLVEKHMRTGIPFPTMPSIAMDTTLVPEFHRAQDLVAKAREAWESIDARIRRDHFGDKPESFLKAISDKHRANELIELGIFKRPEGSQPKAEPKGGEAPAKQEGGGKPPGTV